MAVNLVHQFGRERARELLESSFAQFQADKAVVGLARQLRKSEDALAGYADAAACDHGDFMEYAGLRHRLSDTEKNLAKSRRFDRRQEVIDSLESLRPGDVIEVPGGRFAGMAVVIDPGHAGADREGPRPYVLTADRHARRLSLVDFPTPVGSITRVKIPKNFNGRNPQSRRDLASTLRNRTHNLTPPPPGQGRRGRAAGRTTRARTAGSRSCAASCARTRATQCPDREDHARWSERYFKLDRDATHAQAPHRAAHQHHRPPVRPGLRRAHHARLPRGRGRRVDGHRPRPHADADLQRDGPAHRRVAARRAVGRPRRLRRWPRCSPRWSTSPAGPTTPPPRGCPGGAVKQVLAEMVSIWSDLDALEREHHLDQLHEPDLGFAWAAYRWAEGDELDDILRRHRPRRRRLRALGQAAARPRRPGRRRLRRDRRRCARSPARPPPGCAAGWWRTPRSASRPPAPAPGAQHRVVQRHVVAARGGCRAAAVPRR